MKAVKLTSDNINKIISDDSDNMSVIFFDAEFTNQKDLVQAAISCIEENFSSSDFTLAICDGEEHHEVARKLEVVSLPSIVLVKKGRPIIKSTDLETNKLKSLIQREVQSIADQGVEIKGQDRLTLYLESLIKSAPVMIFMKGKPEQPRCGFSKQLMELMGRNSVKFESFDILENEEVRQGLKEYSNWPTYPQVYANGEFIGGLDILKQLEESGELLETLKAQQKAEGDN